MSDISMSKEDMYHVFRQLPTLKMEEFTQLERAKAEARKQRDAIKDELNLMAGLCSLHDVVQMLAELAEYEITGSAFHFLNTPTPGNVNGTDYYAFVEKPVMSLPHGFYTAAFPLTLTTPTVGAQIRYTTNRTEPTLASTLYSAPLTISTTTISTPNDTIL